MESKISLVCILGALSILIDQSFPTTLREKTLTKVTGTNYGAQRLGTAWIDQSLARCAITCWINYDTFCQTIMYNDLTGLCTPGLSLESGAAGALLAPTGNEGDLYASANPTCDTSDDFTYVTAGNQSACIWVSDFVANFDDATQRCADRGARLFVAPDISKLQLLPPGVYYMIGLTDKAEEGIYKWVDTGEAISAKYATEFFGPGDPNNFAGDEHCIAFKAGSGATGVDINCGINFVKFACERPML